MKLFSSLVVIFIFIIAFCIGIQITHELPPPIPSYTEKVQQGLEHKATTTLFFVGDLMLGRHVENLMRAGGIEYPFVHILKELKEPNITIGNFEGVVTQEHIQALPMTFQFSVREEYLALLRDLGFDILSLANNHAFDYGKDELSYTRSVCRALSILCGGTPNALDTFSTQIQEMHGIRFGFIFLHTLYGEPDAILLQDALQDLHSKSDIQIAYVHWGEEYALVHNLAQENLAHTLIDSGIDAVIGHHPHVIQDIALYREKPIFYSLGNFIFDQYFSTEVQEELGVRMIVSEDTLRYELVPFSSIEVRSQPKHMSDADAQLLYTRILNEIKTHSFVDIHQGSISVPR